MCSSAAVLSFERKAALWVSIEPASVIFCCLFLPHIHVWKLLTQTIEFGQIVVDDIRIVWMEREIVLVIILSWVKGLERRNHRDNLSVKNLRLIQLAYISLGDALLIIGGKKDGRAILRAFVRALPV